MVASHPGAVVADLTVEKLVVPPVPLLELVAVICFLLPGHLSSRWLTPCIWS